MPILDYTGKTCVVTGGADGIGLEMVKLFAQQGAQVFILDLNGKAAEERARALRAKGHIVTGIQCNVASAESVENAFKQIERSGRVDVLCNNAGIGHVGNVLNTTVADMERVMAVNVTGVMLCAKEAIKIMLKDNKGGAILNTGSIASIRPIKDRIAYAASKGAINTLTMALATDHIADGIRVNAVCPGRIHTTFVDNFIKKNYPGKEQEMFTMLSEYMPNGQCSCVRLHMRAQFNSPCELTMCMLCDRSNGKTCRNRFRSIVPVLGRSTIRHRFVRSSHAIITIDVHTLRHCWPMRSGTAEMGDLHACCRHKFQYRRWRVRGRSPQSL